MGFEMEFEKNLKQLMRLLKKMMAQYPGAAKGEDLAKFFKSQKNMPDINIFLLNFAASNPENLDELEEIFEESLFSEGFKPGELKYELNGDDQEFLKRHGIRF